MGGDKRIRLKGAMLSVRNEIVSYPARMELKLVDLVSFIRCELEANVD